MSDVESTPDSNATSTPPVEGLADYAIERFVGATRLAISMASHAGLFAFWVFVAWCAHLVAEFAKAHGVHEYFANAFLWVSSAATFVLTSCYVAADVEKEFRRLFRLPHRISKKAK